MEECSEIYAWELGQNGTAYELPLVRYPRAFRRTAYLFSPRTNP